MIDQSDQIGCYVASRIDSYKTNSRSLPYFFACWLQLVVIVAVLRVPFLFLSFSSAPIMRSERTHAILASECRRDRTIIELDDVDVDDDGDPN